MQKDERLGSAPIRTLVFQLALPAVIAQFVNVLYNIVDRMYIGHIPKVGSLALTGLGICFPILMLISAFSSFVGSGGAPLASIQLGKGNRKEAEKILGNGVTILVFFSITLTILFMVFKQPILYAFGASENTILYANQYLSIYLWGTIFVQAAVGLNMFITCQGQARVAMFSVLIGAIINIVLDPIFIFGFDMGVRGAAIATVISQACSAIWVVQFLLSKKSGLRIRKENLRINRKIVVSIAALGISPFVMQATESLINIVFNSGAQQYGGDLYVGSITILQSVMQLFVVPTQGITMGTQPIISYNYGAGNQERVKETFHYTLRITFLVTCICTGLAIIMPEMFAHLFTSKPELIKLVGKVMPIFMGGVWMFGVQMACQSAFMAMGQAKISLFLALLRKVILLVPLALILPRFMGVMGIYYAEPIADILAAATTGTLFALNFKKILNQVG
ncbi:multi antimicrobial extrusion protein (Na(+)/drug antiporter), MATE family of MDR efflux pumps [Lachnospiraceae bacterium KM106-2]|nr:multi antimicrobial extrusion protein (Na(+)/drug antiporter), MATE family of MDR efflux pumps [Lachnospiraceae bacterium KM106-2]